MISARYPSAQFRVRAGIDDPDEVMDLVIDRLVHLQIEEGLAVSVLSVHTAERAARTREQTTMKESGSLALPSSAIV